MFFIFLGLAVLAYEHTVGNPSLIITILRGGEGFIMVRLIRYVGSILAIIALVLIWKAHQYNTLWWAILVLFILDWMTAEAVRNSVKMGSGEKIENFWTVANIIITLACFVVSIICIIWSVG